MTSKVIEVALFTKRLCNDNISLSVYMFNGVISCPEIQYIKQSSVIKSIRSSKMADRLKDVKKGSCNHTITDCVLPADDESVQ